MPALNPPDRQAWDAILACGSLQAENFCLRRDNDLLKSRLEVVQNISLIADVERAATMEKLRVARHRLKEVTCRYNLLLNRKERKSSKPPGSSFGFIPAQPPATAHEPANRKKRQHRRGPYER